MAIEQLFMTNFFMDLLENKEQVIKVIFRDYDTTTKNKEAFDKLETLYAEGKEVSTDKVLRACSKSLQHLNEVNARLLLFALVYTSGDDFTTDVAKILNKLGRGQEALQAMMKAKLNGG